MGSLFDGLIHVWKLEKDARDSVGDSHGTITGATDVSAKVGRGRDFNGSSDYIEIPDTDDLSFTNGSSDKPFSISMWINPSALSSNGVLICKMDNSVNEEWTTWLLSTGTLVISLSSSHDNSIGRVTTTTISTGTFKHIVFTYDGSESSSGIKIYIDSVDETTTDSNFGTYTNMPNTTQPVMLGMRDSIGTPQTALAYEGKMDEVFIWDREISQEEVNTLYNSGDGALFLNPLNTDLVSYYPFDADASDKLNRNNGTVIGATFLSSGGKFGGAYSFDRTNDVINIGTDPSLSFISGGNDTQFTIGMWVKFTAENFDQILISKWEVAGGSFEWYLSYSGLSSNEFQIILYDSSDNLISADSIGAGPLNAGQWYFIVTTYDGSKSNTGFKFYLDATALSTTLGTSGTYTGTHNSGIAALIGGRKPSSPSILFGGEIDELFIMKREMNAQEIQKLYANGAGNKMSVGLKDSLVGHWDLNVDASDRVQSNDGTLTGTTLVAGQFGNCRDFNGSSDFISISDSDDLSFTDGGGNDKPFSISLWLYSDSVASTRIPISKWASLQREYNIQVQSGGTIHFSLEVLSATGSINTTVAAGAISAGEWYHVVATYDGSKSNTGLKIYKNGILQTSTPGGTGSYTGMGNGTAGLIFGNRGGSFFWDGKLDDVMIFDQELTQADVDKLSVGSLPGIKRGGVFIKKISGIDTRYIKKIGTQTW